MKSNYKNNIFILILLLGQLSIIWLSLPYILCSKIILIISTGFFSYAIISDFFNQEFYLLLAIIPIISLIIEWKNSFGAFTTGEWKIFSILVFVFFILILSKKIGSGDLFYFIIFCGIYGVGISLHILLIACCTALIYIIFHNKNNRSLPFLPFLFLGQWLTLITLLLL